MVKVEELEKQINDYILDLILNSDVERDWNYCFHKDNITINIDEYKFNVKFKDGNWLEYEYSIKVYNSKFKYIFDKDKRKLNKKLKLKLQEIKYYVDNKSKMKKIKQILKQTENRKRKQKLEKLNGEV